MIPLNIPNLDLEDKSSLIDAFDSGWISSAGPDIAIFEDNFRDHIGSKFAVACSSGTSALHSSLIIKGVNSESDVLLPALSFIATANAIRYCNATPIFIDINKETLAIDFNVAKEFIYENYTRKAEAFYNNTSGNILKAILPVHMLGSPFDLDELKKFKQEFNLEVVIDSAEALGSKFKDKNIGSDNFINCFSFNGNKIITTGGGGLITTHSSEEAKRLKHLTTTAKTDPVFFVHDEVGFNYRLINLLARLGISQLKKLDRFIEAKRNIQNIYSQELNSEYCNVFSEPKLSKSNYWLNMLTFSETIIKKYGLKKIIENLWNAGIEVRPMWSIITDLEPYKNFQRSGLNETSKIWSASICIPSSTNLSEIDQSYVIDSIKKLVKH